MDLQVTLIDGPGLKNLTYLGRQLAAPTEINLEIQWAILHSTRHKCEGDCVPQGSISNTVFVLWAIQSCL